MPEKLRPAGGCGLLKASTLKVKWWKESLIPLSTKVMNFTERSITELRVMCTVAGEWGGGSKLACFTGTSDERLKDCY